MPTYRIVDLQQPADPEAELALVEANTPEQAVKLALGETLVRGASRMTRSPRVKVYWNSPDGTLNLVKLYPAA